METIVKKERLTYSDYCMYIKKINEQFPALKIATCGKTLLNREIYSLVMGEGEKNILFVGGTHGLEWITSLVLLRFCEELMQKSEKGESVCGFDVKSILSHRRLIIIPELNPDGIEISLNGESACGEYRKKNCEVCDNDFSGWSANARGVDINHNFNADWYALRDYETASGINGAAPRRFGGEYPESEPETIAVTRICRNINIDMLITLHSQGEEIYYEYGENTPERAELMAKMFSALTDYTLVKNSGHAASGGLKDWFIEEFCKPAFTVEVGKGANPLPVNQLDEIYEKIKPLLVVAMML